MGSLNKSLPMSGYRRNQDAAHIHNISGRNDHTSSEFRMHAPPDQRKLLEPPLHFLFGYLKEEERIRIHLNQNNKMVIEGKIVGFDEFMNIVMQDAFEVHLPTGARTPLGTMLLRGECVGIVHVVPHTYE
jgi:small nuclear ribonucleoprotein E